MPNEVRSRHRILCFTGLLLVGLVISGCGEALHSDLYDESSTNCGSALEADYDTLLEPVFSTESCDLCHNNGNTTDFNIDPTLSTLEKIRNVLVVSDLDNPELSRLATHPTQASHGGGALIVDGSADQDAIVEFIELLAADVECN